MKKKDKQRYSAIKLYDNPFHNCPCLLRLDCRLLLERRNVMLQNRQSLRTSMLIKLYPNPKPMEKARNQKRTTFDWGQNPQSSVSDTGQYHYRNCHSRQFGSIASKPRIAGSSLGRVDTQRQRVCTAPNLRDRSEESVDLASPNDSLQWKIVVFGAEVPCRRCAYLAITVGYRPIALQRSGIGTVAAFAATLFSPKINFHILL